jgi:hypothetical protein
MSIWTIAPVHLVSSPCRWHRRRHDAWYYYPTAADDQDANCTLTSVLCQMYAHTRLPCIEQQRIELGEQVFAKHMSIVVDVQQ